MNNERFLVFDIDDTLYSQMEPLLTACEFSLGRKLPDPELFYRIFGKRSAEMFLFSESGQVSIHESRIYRIENTMKDLGIPFTREQAELFQERYKENQSHLHVSGVMTQLLDECEAAGVKMGVITNGPFSHQVQKFHILGLDKWFTEDHLIVSAGVGVAKPDVQIFRMAEEKWGMEPENTFMIGDSLENDIAGAKKCRMEDHLDEPSPLYGSGRYGKTRLYCIYRGRVEKAYCPNMLYNEEGWIKYGIRLQNHHGAGRIRDGLLP